MRDLGILWVCLPYASVAMVMEVALETPSSQIKNKGLIKG